MSFWSVQCVYGVNSVCSDADVGGLSQMSTVAGHRTLQVAFLVWIAAAVYNLDGLQ